MLGFIIKAWNSSVNPSTFADQTVYDSLCCSYKYNWCVCSFLGQLYILILSAICISAREDCWIKLKLNKMTIKPSPPEIKIALVTVRALDYLIYILTGCVVWINTFESYPCVFWCVRACVRVCVRACACVCVSRQLLWFRNVFCIYAF